MSITLTAGKLRFVRHTTGYPGPMSYFALGQRREHSALAALYLYWIAGGPGPPIVDRLRRNLSDSVTIKPVVITGRKGANTLSGGYIGLPLRTFVSTLQLL